MATRRTRTEFVRIGHKRPAVISIYLIMISFRQVAEENKKSQKLKLFFSHFALFEVPEHPAAPDGKDIALHGVFGYDNIDDHMNWRETARHAKIIKSMGVLGNDWGLKSADIYGRDMFHVKFESGI